ncbi:hypothetical protein WN944_001431 [Citrus x changshan-huyou]|uniref:Uncharacterized protein n=1 Tax=Citrus x changshan-huyou TaxID=2935761 RepID=A0AAP0QUS7_9ROSI
MDIKEELWQKVFDFKWERPKKVEVLSIDETEPIAMSDCRDEGGGVEIGVVFDNQNIEVFTFFFHGLRDI